jgi:uncharacterized membrane protein YhaH (DUF805 family)
LKSFDFKGITNRKQFWLATAANLIIVLTIVVVAVALGILHGNSAIIIPVALVFIYSIATIVPSISIQIHRLRDAGLSPWLIPCSLIPCVDEIILFVISLLPSKSATAM